MQRKQLERYYDVKIYQEQGGYIVVMREGEKKFRYIANVEKFLEERKRKHGKR